MKLNAKFFALFLGVFSLASLAHAVDTLEVFVLRVQFKEEKPSDNSLTTGTGLFDSDTATYNLDPSGSRKSIHYWRKHLAFANAYYKAASGGELFVKDSIIPTVFEIDKPMIDYNRTQKMKGEKAAAYDEARSRDYVRFVYDAVMAAHKSENSPFKIPLSKNPKTKRAFMIAHAGASRLLDGGSMGTKGANTPGDFLDIYLSREDWVWGDSLSGVVIAEDSLNNGLLLKGSAIDTLKSVMVVSETASQDGLNWGINGIIVNQIGRELGMPNTYDVAKGISRLGYFDMMDFAGYNAGNGFFPVLPAAWERIYMGWSSVKEVRPTAGHPVTVDIAAAGSGLGTEIVKVALSGSEYILIENRQRSWKKDGMVEVYLGEAKQNDDTTDTREILVDSLSTVFLDSICNNGKCDRNKKKAKGLVLGVSSFDAGLPASGIAVWKVNDWYLRESLKYGFANQWGGDQYRDHQFGLALVESDEVLSIGKTFKNAIGEDSYDYGSGTDLLPHLRYAKDKKFDTVKTIKPTGYANTATMQGGYTGLKISVEIPKNARIEKTANAFMGDSVVNFAAPVIRVTISVDDGSIENSKFPKNVGLANAVRGAVFVNYEDDETGKAIVFASEDGTLQAMNALGDTLFASDTSVVLNALTRDDVKHEIPLYRVGQNFGKLVGIAGDGDRVYSLHENYLVRTALSAGVPMQDVMDLQKKAAGVPAAGEVMAGPIIANSHLFFASDSGFWVVNLSDEMTRSFVSTGDIRYPQDMALCKVDGKEYFSVVVGEDGKIFMRKFSLENKADAKPSFSKLKAGYAQVSATKHEKFRVACTDLDRDGTVDAVVLGSRGTVASVKLAEGGEVKAKWTREYKRGAAGTSGLDDENSGIAFGDVNGDAYPEIVFLGDNLVYVLDRFGVPIDGFPVTINRGAPIVGFHSDPLIIDVNGDKDNLPEILVPSNDGLVYAYTGKGKRVSERFPLAAGSFELIDSLEQVVPMSIYVTDAVKDSKGPELYAFHRNSVSAFRLDKAANGAEKAAAAWALPAGGNERTGFFDASKLGDVETAKAKDEISDFFIYPNPVRGGDAKVRMELGAKPESIKLELYDITGLCVFKTNIPDGVAGMNQANLDLRDLGSDVYTARLKVKFESGKTKQKLYRVGVVR